MKDYYSNTRKCIDTYNSYVNAVFIDSEELSDDRDEFLQNFCLYLAHALIKDAGPGQIARDELSKVADIINDVCV